jgi:hypothetical protein
MSRKMASAMVAASLCLMGGHAAAQTEAEFIAAFAGDWQAVDGRHSQGGTCTLKLGTGGGEGSYELTKSDCQGQLDEVTSWSIANAQMVLRNDTGTVATLGGNQRRMSGTASDGMPVVLDRVPPSGTIDPLRAARQVYGCFYAGFTSQCASQQQLTSPVDLPEGDASVTLLVNLNVRSEAREDSAVIGVVPAQSCIATDLCLETADGAWCRARFGERDGWIRKQALRQSRWPVITFSNGCAG